MPHWNVKLANAIRKVQAETTMPSAELAALADELASSEKRPDAWPYKWDEARKTWCCAAELAPPEKKPKPPDGWEFEDYEHPRLPEKGEWILWNGEPVQYAFSGWQGVQEAYILRCIPGPEGWREEFYPKPASEVSAEDALDHCKQKHIGFRPENLMRYGLRWSGTVPCGAYAAGRLVLGFGCETCALCAHHISTAGFYDGNCDCPLEHAVPGACSSTGGVYGQQLDTGDPEPMIAALEKAIVERDRKAELEEVQQEHIGAYEKQKAERDAKKPRKPQPGEFVVTPLGHTILITTYDEYAAARGHTAINHRYCYGRHSDGTAWSVRAKDLKPWTPKVGNEVWAIVNGRWYKGIVEREQPYERYQIRIPRRVWPSLSVKSLRPLAFPPPKCCATCGAER